MWTKIVEGGLKWSKILYMESESFRQTPDFLWLPPEYSNFFKNTKQKPENFSGFFMSLCHFFIVRSSKILVCNWIIDDFFCFGFETKFIFWLYISSDVSSIYKTFDEIEMKSSDFSGKFSSVPKWSCFFYSIVTANAVTSAKITRFNNESIFHKYACVRMKEETWDRLFRQNRTLTQEVFGTSREVKGELFGVLLCVLCIHIWVIKGQSTSFHA